MNRKGEVPLNAITIVLILVVIVIGFMIAGNVRQGQTDLVNITNTAQCLAQGGVCSLNCPDEAVITTIMPVGELCPQEGAECCEREAVQSPEELDGTTTATTPPPTPTISIDSHDIVWNVYMDTNLNTNTRERIREFVSRHPPDSGVSFVFYHTTIIDGQLIPPERAAQFRRTRARNANNAFFSIYTAEHGQQPNVQYAVGGAHRRVIIEAIPPGGN